MKTFKRRSQRRRSQRRQRSRSRGGGYGDGPAYVAPGYLVHTPYIGPGKDCTGDPQSIGRPGYISNYNPYGLPGLKGGKRFRRKRLRGGTKLYPASTDSFSVADPITNPNTGPVSGGLTPKPGYFPDTTGVGGTVSAPGVPPQQAQQPAQPQKGGRYGFFPGLGPLNPSNGVGISPAPFGRIPCESGTTNPLNLNPNGIQSMTTAPLMPPYVRGGSRRQSRTRSRRRSRGGSNLASVSNFPVVHVGAADSMRYYAPTAGYRNDFTTFQAPSAVPGLTIQTPYDARSFNQACIKGGSRKAKKGGACPVAFGAGEFSQLKMGELMNRSDFDGSNRGLPVKCGGSRRRR